MNLSSVICNDFKCGYTLILDYNGNVYSLGNCKFGAHGFNNICKIQPTRIDSLLNIKTITCGYSHTICIDYNGNMFSFGKNNAGQLGLGKTKDELEFTHIPQQINIFSVLRVSCGYDYTICLTTDTCLYSFGYNKHGQLGLGHENFTNSPQQIPTLNDIEYIECGAHHAICKTVNNIYYSWGNNRYGQLGHKNTNCTSPIKCKNWPSNIISIKCGEFNSVLLTEEGKIYCFGSNIYGQLGLNDNSLQLTKKPTLIKKIPKIQRIECGYLYVTCIDINKNLWLFGSNYSGQLGLGDTENRYKPILHPTLKNIIDISSGGNHIFVKTIDNKIYAFGKNLYSQIGIDTSEEDQLTPIQVFEDNEDIWFSFIGKSRAKSARK